MVSARVFKIMATITAANVDTEVLAKESGLADITGYRNNIEISEAISRQVNTEDNSNSFPNMKNNV